MCHADLDPKFLMQDAQARLTHLSTDTFSMKQAVPTRTFAPMGWMMHAVHLLMRKRSSDV